MKVFFSITICQYNTYYAPFSTLEPQIINIIFDTLDRNPLPYEE